MHSCFVSAWPELLLLISICTEVFSCDSVTYTLICFAAVVTIFSLFCVCSICGLDWAGVFYRISNCLFFFIFIFTCVCVCVCVCVYVPGIYSHNLLAARRKFFRRNQYLDLSHHVMHIFWRVVQKQSLSICFHCVHFLQYVIVNGDRLWSHQCHHNSHGHGG